MHICAHTHMRASSTSADQGEIKGGHRLRLSSPAGGGHEPMIPSRARAQALMIVRADMMVRVGRTAAAHTETISLYSLALFPRDPAKPPRRSISIVRPPAGRPYSPPKGSSLASFEPTLSDIYMCVCVVYTVHFCWINNLHVDRSNATFCQLLFP
jgi:hypothetical protein